MEAIIPQSKKIWDDWIVANTDHHSFAQSWEWGEILRAEGKMVERYIFLNNGTAIAEVQAIKNKLPFGWAYAFCPKGPTLAKNYTGGVTWGAKDLLAEQRVVFVRIETTYQPIKVGFNAIPTKDINPRATVILELNKDENKILAEMHPKTRYNIHLAIKKNLRVDKEKNEEVFYQLMKATGARDGFRLHSHAHYHQILQSSLARQITIYSGDKPIAVGVFISFGDTFTYLYGASNYKERALMAPYLTQWEGIKMGKQLGHKFYDFFGIAPGVVDSAGDLHYNEKHQYAGMTRFKLGFGGSYREDPGTFDLIISPGKYKIYQLMRFIRRLV